MSDRREQGDTWIVAIHEAAHAVINYRCTGFAGGPVSIIPNPEDGTLGRVEDGISDTLDVADMKARVLSCYAGGHAQREVDPSVGVEGCESDDAIATELLREFGISEQENDLRQHAQLLVRRHWAEIVGVAEALRVCRTLDDTEVEILADIAAGGATHADLSQYRALRTAP